MTRAFPQELRDLAKAKAEAQDRYGKFAMAPVEADPEKRVEQTIEIEMASRALEAAHIAFSKAMSAYMASQRVTP